MSVTITGPFAPNSGQVSGTQSTVDRQADLGVKTTQAPGTAPPSAGVAPEPVTTPSPVTLPPVVPPGDAVLDGDDARRGGHGRVNRGQVRSQLSHLANAVKHGLKELAKSGALDESAEQELRTLARSFKTTVKSLFKDAKDGIRSGGLDADALLADVRAAYDDVRASASEVLAPAAGDAPDPAADDDAPAVSAPATEAPVSPGGDTGAVAAPDGEPVEPVGPIEPAETPVVLAGAPDAAGAEAPDPLAPLDAVFDEFLAALSDLLSRFTDAGTGDAADAGAPAPAAPAADASAYAQVASSDDPPAGGFDASA